MKKESVRRGLVFADTHLSAYTIDHPSWSLFKRFAKDYSPDFTVNLGDFGGWDIVASLDKRTLREREGKRIKKEFEKLSSELDEIQKFSKFHTLLEGNHDRWVEKYIDNAPELEGIFNLPISLNLRERGVEWVRYEEQPYYLGEVALLHGWWANLNAPKKHMERIGGSLVHGHVHRFGYHVHPVPARDEVWQAWSLGCLTYLRPPYKYSPITNWANGFATLDIAPDGTFDLHPVIISNGLFVLNGVKYTLKEAVHGSS